MPHASMTKRGPRHQAWGCRQGGGWGRSAARGQGLLLAMKHEPWTIHNRWINWLFFNLSKTNALIDERWIICEWLDISLWYLRMDPKQCFYTTFVVQSLVCTLPMWYYVFVGRQFAVWLGSPGWRGAILNFTLLGTQVPRLATSNPGSQATKEFGLSM